MNINEHLYEYAIPVGLSDPSSNMRDTGYPHWYSSIMRDTGQYAQNQTQ